jgi:hypothetical protein
MELKKTISKKRKVSVGCTKEWISEGDALPKANPSNRVDLPCVSGTKR